MNIFYVDKNPITAATMLCDKHVIKMILESCQMLSTAHHVLGSSVDKSLFYKPTHKNHPSNVWVRFSRDNYFWLLEHTMILCSEYTRRYSKVHKSEAMLSHLNKLPDILGGFDFIDPPKCMPDEYKVDDTVESYRNYYRGAKAYMAKWKLDNVPDWFNVEQNQSVVQTV